MNVLDSGLPGVLIIEPRRFEDERGWFMEGYNSERYDAIGLPAFVQDNIAWSRPGVLRGLHYQWPRAQGKLVSVLDGAVLDVAVDLRRDSPHRLRWIGVELSRENRRQLWIPGGFAHGYCVLGGGALVGYKCTEVYLPDQERSVRWNDPALGIEWPNRDPILSEKDRHAPLLSELSPEAIP